MFFCEFCEILKKLSELIYFYPPWNHREALDCLIWWPIAAIEKKTFKIEKKLYNQEKIFRIEKKIWNPEKYFRVKRKIYEIEKKIKIEKNISEPRKTFYNREKNFKIEKNVSESRNTLLQESRKNLEFNDLEFNEPPS